MAWKSLKHINKVLSLYFEFNFTLILLITLNFPCHLLYVESGYIIQCFGSYCHGSVVIIEECTLKHGSYDSFGVNGACSPFYENYISDIGSYHAVIGNVPNVFYFPAVLLQGQHIDSQEV
jgi:hypothetical protein